MPGVRYHMGKFPPGQLDFGRLVPLIGPANAAVARYDGVLHAVPNAQILLSPLTTQEAVLSSKIEGTQATFGEVLEFEASEETASGEKRDDIHEVLQYRAALQHAVSAMKDIPLSQRLIRDAHRVLMTGVRGENKSPGSYRRIPTWIGKPGGTLEQALFVPPGASDVPSLMTAWERYLHADAPDTLVQLAILHVEFEAIHPFLDGNGRLGRLLIPLFLVQKQLLSGPHFYLSAYLESHRDEYYERLRAVSRSNDWTGWCEFFLRAIAEQAKSNEQKARAILSLYRRKRDWIVSVTKSQHAVRALDWLFARPIFEASDLAKTSGIPQGAAGRILRQLRESGMLKELRSRSGRKAAILAFAELVSIADGRSST